MARAIASCARSISMRTLSVNFIVGVDLSGGGGGGGDADEDDDDDDDDDDEEEECGTGGCFVAVKCGLISIRIDESICDDAVCFSFPAFGTPFDESTPTVSALRRRGEMTLSLSTMVFEPNETSVSLHMSATWRHPGCDSTAKDTRQESKHISSPRDIMPTGKEKPRAKSERERTKLRLKL